MDTTDRLARALAAVDAANAEDPTTINVDGRPVARELVYDNLATAVAEHDGRLVRFAPRFLGFAREYGFCPRACNPASGWEKGKVERAIGYVRRNFWPLRQFTDLHDVNRQARQWLSEIANRRVYAETRELPIERSSRRRSVTCR